jgi:hypothetical protein
MISLPFIAAASLASVQPGPSPTATPAQLYARVTGPALREALLGKYVQPRRCVGFDPCGGIFNRNGYAYHRAGDFVPWTTESYFLDNDQVCIFMPGGASRCLFLARSTQGAYFMVSADGPSTPPEEVQISDATGIVVPGY